MPNERLRRARAALRAIAKGLRELRTVSVAIPPLMQHQTSPMHEWAQRAMLVVEKFDDVLIGRTNGATEPLGDPQETKSAAPAGKPSRRPQTPASSRDEDRA